MLISIRLFQEIYFLIAALDVGTTYVGVPTRDETKKGSSCVNYVGFYFILLL